MVQRWTFMDSRKREAGPDDWDESVSTVFVLSKPAMNACDTANVIQKL